MKTADEINHARERLCERLQEPGLSDAQTVLLKGMLNALFWVADGEHGSTVDRVLSNEPIAKARPQ